MSERYSVGFEVLRKVGSVNCDAPLKAPWYLDKHYNGLIAQSQTALRART